MTITQIVIMYIDTDKIGITRTVTSLKPQLLSAPFGPSKCYTNFFVLPSLGIPVLWWTKCMAFLFLPLISCLSRQRCSFSFIAVIFISFSHCIWSTTIQRIIRFPSSTQFIIYVLILKKRNLDQNQCCHQVRFVNLHPHSKK